ncbi:MAG TPA: hypothetical protein VMF59_14610 [Bacteroidota bacterium]|nr:hypothetical protein [Bacteroidota bacterium]
MRNPLPLFFLIVVATIGSVWILLSQGFFPVDECAHYLYSRFVITALPFTVETWHRPGLLWLFALPAQWGHTFTMFFALALYICLLVVTYRIAVLMKIPHAAWVILFTGLQPVLFDISYACLAEMPAALVLALSYWARLKGKDGWSLALASCVFLFRFEMYGFALLLFLLLLREKKWRILPLVLAGPLVWIGSSALISGDLMTFFREWSDFSHLGKYVPGISLTFYLENLQKIFGITQVLFAGAGILLIIRRRRTADFGILLFAIAMNIIVNTLAGAEVLHWTGSIGEFRYVAVVGPFVAVIATFGLSEILEAIRPAWGKIVLEVAVIGAVAFNCTLSTRPRMWENYEKIVLNLARAAHAEYPEVTLLSNNSLAAYVYDVAPSGGPHYRKLDARMVAKFTRCLILWDPYSSNPRFFQTGLSAESMLRDSSLTVADQYTYGDSSYIVFLKRAGN